MTTRFNFNFHQLSKLKICACLNEHQLMLETIASACSGEDLAQRQMRIIKEVVSKYFIPSDKRELVVKRTYAKCRKCIESYVYIIENKLKEEACYCVIS